MYIELYKYVEGDEDAERGEYLGYVSLEDDDIYIDVDDEKLVEKLEDIFSQPVSYSRSSLEPEKEIEPYTEDFFRVIPAILPESHIRGILKKDEDEEEEFEKPRRQRDEDLEEEEEMEEEEMPVGMSMDEIDEDEYDMDEDSHMSNHDEDDDY
jgi:hypothetical protein